MNLPPTLTKRLRKYRPEPGDEFVTVTDIGPQHRGRLFEAVFATEQPDGAERIVGQLRDAEHYLLNGVVMIRFEGERLGITCKPDDKVLLKAPDATLPKLDLRLRENLDGEHPDHTPAA